MCDSVMGGNMAASENPYSFNEMEASIIQEIGNIMVSAYLGSISTMLNVKMRPSIPYMSIDMANAILSVPAIEFGKVADRALFIESKFSIDSVDIGGCFIFIPDFESLERILRGLGVV
jgi:chemotaxis protein CheC